MGDTTLPFLREPHDTLRQGLPALKEAASASHPVEAAVAGAGKQAAAEDDFATSRRLYGVALPARLDLERQVAGRSLRLPGLGVPSSRVGLEVVSGTLDSLGPRDIYGRPEDSPEEPLMAHVVLNKGIGAKVQTRHV